MDNRLDEEVGDKMHDMLQENFGLVELKLSDVEVGRTHYTNCLNIILSRQ